MSLIYQNINNLEILFLPCQSPLTSISLVSVPRRQSIAALTNRNQLPIHRKQVLRGNLRQCLPIREHISALPGKWRFARKHFPHKHLPRPKKRKQVLHGNLRRSLPNRKHFSALPRIWRLTREYFCRSKRMKSILLNGINGPQSQIRLPMKNGERRPTE